MPQRHHRYIMSIATLLLATTAVKSHILVQQNQDPANKKPEEANASKSSDIPKWKLYRNEQYGFQVKFPETWTVNSSRGTPPEIIYFRSPYRGGIIGRALCVAVQLKVNPRKLSIEEWFAERMHAVDSKKLDAKGCSSVAGRPSCFFDHTGKLGKERFIYTLLHKTDVLSFNYDLGTEDSRSYAAIVDSFQVLN